MIDPRERALFDRIVNLLTEQETLKSDLAELKIEATESSNSSISPERWGDLVAVARLKVMDAEKRRRKDEQRRRRDDLEGQLALPGVDDSKVRNIVKNYIDKTAAMCARDGGSVELTDSDGKRLFKIDENGVVKEAAE